MTDETEIRYRRARFTTRLPTDRVYSAAHYWMEQVEPGTWRVGYTRFATRMLGEFVEMAFGVEPGDGIEIGQVIGWVEGFKAVSDVYNVIGGAFAGGNPELRDDITLIETDCYGRGWLYAAKGTPEPKHLSAQEYAGLLDGTIDAMLAQDADKYA